MHLEDSSYDEKPILTNINMHCIPPTLNTGELK